MLFLVETDAESGSQVYYPYSKHGPFKKESRIQAPFFLPINLLLCYSACRSASTAYLLSFYPSHSPL